MKFNNIFYVFTLILIFIIAGACSFHKKEKNDPPISKPMIEVENINVILENSGSMAGYLNGTQFKKTVTDFIAELDKIQAEKGDNFLIKNLSYFTFSDNLKFNKFSGDAYSFCSAINNKSLAVGKTSPIDDFIKLLVDSLNTNTIDILISDFVIDKKIKNIEQVIQSEFNIIFNTAKQKELGLIIYRLTSDFTGNYLPAIGGSQQVKNLTRPYFIWLIGPITQLNILRQKIQKSNVFTPENEISFGLPSLPQNKEVLALSNRTGSWRFREGEFIKAGLKNGQLKFTIAFDLSNLPNYVKNIDYLNQNTVIESSSLNILQHKFYSKNEFGKKIHKKEKQKLFDNTHFLEINISQIDASTNILIVTLRKAMQDWFVKFSTNNDSLIKNGNNLNTFMLDKIVAGIANAYGDLESNTNYFQLKYKINQ